MKNFLKQSATLILLGSTLFALQLFAFTEPSSSPPASNAPAPLHVGSQGQTKTGGLTLNADGAQHGLLVQNGLMGIGTLNPSQTLEVAGNIKAGGICINSDCRTVWPSHGRTFYTSSGTFTVPTETTKVWITISGGGGGGGSGTDCGFGGSGGGGGGGGTFKVRELSVSPGTTYSIAVGAGGTPGIKYGCVDGSGHYGCSGGNGGSSSFSSLSTVYGGAGGFGGANGGQGGAGASPGGSNGSPGAGSNGGGNGGSSTFGSGGNGGVGPGPGNTSGAAGSNGTGYGGGGGGGSVNVVDGCYGAGGYGGYGTPGFVLVEW